MRMPFEAILGNEKVKKILKQQIDTNRVLHSYLFVGIEGIGKKKMAMEFADMLLCEGQNKPCHTCSSCLIFRGENHPDFQLIEADGKIKIEQIRQLQEKIAEKPIHGNRKIVIIDNSDCMTLEAQNCLLKTLEEPPEYVVMILITSNENRIIKTILSRCTKISFEPIEEAILFDYLRNEKQEITEHMIKMCEGSFKKAMTLTQDAQMYQKVEKLCQSIQGSSLLILFHNAEVLYENKERMQDILSYMNALFLERSRQEQNKLPYLNGIQKIEMVRKRIEGNSNIDMCIDKLLFELWEELNS